MGAVLTSLFTSIFQNPKSTLFGLLAAVLGAAVTYLTGAGGGWAYLAPVLAAIVGMLSRDAPKPPANLVK